MDSTISEYCTRISNQRQTILAEQLKPLFDLIVIELNKNNNDNSTIDDDYCKIIDTLKNLHRLTLIDQLIVNNEIFYLIQNILLRWAKSKWITDVSCVIRPMSTAFWIRPKILPFVY
ncbi:unnamed protein product [Rotaria sp. Silwood2]|nr:unnamed protein product [Rotaria sp. Silwood2]